MVLKDGRKGIWMRASELEEERQKENKPLWDWLSTLKPGEEVVDTRSGSEAMADAMTRD